MAKEGLSSHDASIAQALSQTLNQLPYVGIIGPGDDDSWNLPDFKQHADQHLKPIVAESLWHFNGAPWFAQMGRYDDFHFDGGWPTKETFARGMRSICDLFLFLCDLQDVHVSLEGTPCNEAAEPLLLSTENQEQVQRDVNQALRTTTTNVEAFRKKSRHQKKAQRR